MFWDWGQFSLVFKLPNLWFEYENENSWKWNEILWGSSVKSFSFQKSVCLQYKCWQAQATNDSLNIVTQFVFVYLKGWHTKYYFASEKYKQSNLLLILAKNRQFEIKAETVESLWHLILLLKTLNLILWHVFLFVDNI